MYVSTNIDIRLAGSRNVGGRNAFEVTGKKWIGIIVVIIDILKGIMAIWFVLNFFPNDVLLYSIAMSSVVLGHCYPVWLKFHGGRGLATTAGVFLMTSWAWVALWLIMYILFLKITNNVHGSSAIALVGTPIIGLLVPTDVVSKFIRQEFSVDQFLLASLLVMAVCLSRHIEPLRDYSKK